MKIIQRIIAFAAIMLTCASFASPQIIICYTDFLRFEGITYVAQSPGNGEIRDEAIGSEFAKVQFKLADNPNRDKNRRSTDGDAAFLAPGTSVHLVKGYGSTFRLAARTEDRWVMYEADENPNARNGADLLDIKPDQVVYIGVNSEADRKIELGAIKNRTQIADLVQKVLEAPVDQKPNGRSYSGQRYLIVFHLRDGTVTSRGYSVRSGELHRGIKLPPEFTAAIEEAVKRRENVRELLQHVTPPAGSAQP